MSNVVKPGFNQDNKITDIILEKAKVCLQTSLHYLRINDSQTGAFLQSTDIELSMFLDTAGVCLSPSLAEYNLKINPVFFTVANNNKQQIGLLQHEMFHIIFGHLAKIPFKITAQTNKKEKDKWNIAADLSINQYINKSMLPNGALNVKTFTYVDKDGNTVPFPLKAPMETYYSLLTDEHVEQIVGKDGICSQCGGSVNGKDKEGNDLPEDKKCQCNGKHGKIIDDHSMWDEVRDMDESEALKATERAITKICNDFSKMPDYCKDFMEYSGKRRAQLNYKSLISKAIRRTISGGQKKSTWRRPNRKYGELSKGKKSGDVPYINIYIDTSGSISVEEANDFVDIIKGCCKATSSKCLVHLWHTKIYYKKQFRRSSVIKPNEMENGGTDLTDTLKCIAKTKPDLSLILTDGYYDDVEFERMISRDKKFPTTVFVITKEGNNKHPLSRLGSTIKIPQ